MPAWAELIRPQTPGEDYVPEPVPPPVSQRGVVGYSLRTQRGHLVMASTFTALHQAAEVAVPIVIGFVIDRAVGRGDGVALIGWIAVLAAVFAVLTVSMRIGLRRGTRGIEGTGHALRILLVRRVLDERGTATSAQTAGDLLSTSSVDAAGVGMYNSGVRRILSAIGALVVAAAVLLTVSLPLGLLILLGLPPWLLFMSKLAAPVARRVRAQRSTAAKASKEAADYVQGLRVLAGIGAAGEATRRFARTSEISRRASVRSVTAQAVYDGLNTALTGVFLAIVAIVAGFLADQRAISIGQIVIAVGLASALIGPFSIITGAIRILAGARVSASRVADALTVPYAAEGGNETVSPGRLEVSADRLSFSVGPGEFVGVVMADPAAAARLLNILAGKQDAGVRIGGADLSTVDRFTLRRTIGVSFHDAPLFSGTLKENVLAGAPEDRLVDALAAAAAEDIVDGLPEGVDTVLAERGRSLSGGQRQRLALARALAARHPILVLHDPSTAVDAVTEARIGAGVRAARTGLTTVVVTSSPILLAAADRVLLVTDGEVVATGTHAELVARPDYRDLVLQ